MGARLGSVTTNEPHPAQPDPLEPYREAVAKTGRGFAATLWASERTQKLRFDVLIDLLGADRLEGAVVLDLGCGDGALAAHLIQRGITCRRYIGVDGLHEQVVAGEARQLPNTDFACRDLLDTPESLGQWGADIAVISGTLNTMTQDMSIQFVTQAFSAVNVALAFNFLSDRPAPERVKAALGPARRHDVVRWLDEALELTPLVGFRQDHLDGHDAAIVLRHRT
jgi:SAM-dependent methyltransferase